MEQKPKDRRRTRVRPATRNARLAALAAILATAPLLTACPAKKEADTVRIDAERFRVPLRDDEYALGGDNPLVTVVVYSDYACTPCGRSWQVMKHLSEHYGDELRIVFRSYTIAGFQHGDTAAEAAFAAGAQGKFWEMHWRLFEDKDSFSRPSLRAHAEAVGLDVPKFFDELDTGVHAGRRMRDRREATVLGIRALPVAFVNGLFLMGYHDEQAWRDLIDAEIKQARALLKEGTSRADVYAAFMKSAKEGPVQEVDAAKELREERREEAEKTKRTLESPQADQRYAVLPGDAVALGPEDAAVAVIEFVDFQCPFCRRAHTETMLELRKKYGDKVRFVARHLPLEFHPAAPGAAKASIAARRQGKFWEFHDALLGGERPLSHETFLEIAGELELDIEKFKTDMQDPEVQRQIDDDVALSRRLGVQATPAFFINGRYLEGALSRGTFERYIDEELALAEKKRGEGVKAGEELAAIMADALPEDQYPNASLDDAP